MVCWWYAGGILLVCLEYVGDMYVGGMLIVCWRYDAVMLAYVGSMLPVYCWYVMGYVGVSAGDI